MVLHDTSGDSLTPLQVYTSGRTEPGLSESTMRVKVPDEVADCTGCCPDPAGWEGSLGDCRVDWDEVEVHPPTITDTDRMRAKSMNPQIRITGKGHPE
jgi:hypothetical protein